MIVKLGLPCVYRPRVPYGRQSELFCFITRIIREDEGIVDLIAFPANSEPVHYNSVARRSEAINIHCWEPAIEETVDGAGVRGTIKNLELRIVALEKRLSGKGQHQGEAQRMQLLNETAAR